MGEKGLSVAGGDETFDDDVFEAEPATEPAAEPATGDDHAWMPEREPAFASDLPAADDDDAASGDALGLASGG